MRHAVRGFLPALLILSACHPTLVTGSDSGIDVITVDGTTVDAQDGSSVPVDAMGSDIIPVDAPIAMDAHDAGPACPWAVTRSLMLTDSVSGTLGTTGGVNNVATCTAPLHLTNMGADRVFTLVITQRTGEHFAVTRTDVPDGPIHTVPLIMVRRACDNVATEIGCTFGIPGIPSSGTLDLVLDPGVYYVIVDGASDVRSGSEMFNYMLTLSPFTPSANAACPPTIQLMGGATLTMQHTANGSNAGVLCGQFVGPTVYYSATVPAHAHLGVDATITGGAQQNDHIFLQVLDSCNIGSCMGVGQGNAPQTDGGIGTPALAGLDNNSNNPRTVIIAVSTTPDPMAPNVTFDLSSSVSPIPYALTMIPAACENMSNATVLTAHGGGVFTDDSASDVLALPFAFTYFGTAFVNYSVASNGFAQLFPDLTGMPSFMYQNTALPSPTAPPSLIGPFWGDLVPVTQTVAGMPTSIGNIRTQTFGDLRTSTGYFTIGWYEFRPISDAAAHMIFQLKLFQSTNVIEFHYCSLTHDADAGMVTDDLITGSSATIGLQNAGGTSGAQFSFDMPHAISQGTALRFSPH